MTYETTVPDATRAIARFAHVPNYATFDLLRIDADDVLEYFAGSRPVALLTSACEPLGMVESHGRFVQGFRMHESMRCEYRSVATDRVIVGTIRETFDALTLEPDPT